MYEVEVKVRAEHAAVRDRLATVDAEPMGSVVQHDTYYDHPSRSFASTDEALRVRRERSDGAVATTITYKGPKVDDGSKTRREVETTIGDADAAESLLSALGFRAVAAVRKERERFALEGFVVALDEVDGLEEFVEVEAEGGKGEIEALRSGAREVLSRLGLDPDEQIRTSYLGLIIEGESGRVDN